MLKLQIMNVSNFFHPDLTKDNIAKSLLAFTLPLMISLVFQQFYNAVDTIIVGHYLGETSLAAIGACASIYELLVGFGTGFGNGLGIVAARAYGANNIEQLKKVVASSAVITVFVTIFIMIFGQLTLKPILSFLGTPSEIIEEAYSYIWFIAIFSGVLFAYNLLSGLLRAIGNSFMPLVFLIISSFLNIFLDILMIVKFNLGVKGTAIATVAAQGISALLCFFYIIYKVKILIPTKKHFKAESKLYSDLIGQGLSMALMSAIVSSGSIVLQAPINSFGTMIIAGHISARKIFGITNIPLIAIGTAAATFVSQNLGAQKIDRIKKVVRTANIMCVIWGILCTVVIPLTAKILISAISGSSNEEVISYGSKYIIFMQPFYAILGILVVTRNSLQGLGSKIVPLFSSVIEFLGKVLFTVAIIPHTGIRGIIMCEPLIWCAMTVQLVWAYKIKIEKVQIQTRL